MNINIILLILLSVLIYTYIYNRELFTQGDYVNMEDYDIQEIPNFLTDEECNKIIELSNGKLFPSRVYSQNDDVYSTNTRKSQQCWLQDDNPIIKGISDKVRQATNTPHNYQEQLQVVNYPVGGFFSPHYDACEGDKDFCKRMNGDNGPRLFTVLFYLNDNYEGGETVFPKINKSVKPAKGKAVIFRNVNDDGVIIKQALHGGEPIKSGEKWIANKWIRLGKN
jgi:prolyl 4-hydroxylase